MTQSGSADPVSLTVAPYIPSLSRSVNNLALQRCSCSPQSGFPVNFVAHESSFAACASAFFITAINSGWSLFILRLPYC